MDTSADMANAKGDKAIEVVFLPITEAEWDALSTEQKVAMIAATKAIDRCCVDALDGVRGCQCHLTASQSQDGADTMKGRAWV